MLKSVTPGGGLCGTQVDVNAVNALCLVVAVKHDPPHLHASPACQLL